MGNIANTLIQSVSYSINASTISSLLKKNTNISNAAVDNISFANVLARLNRNLDSVGVSDVMTSSPYNTSNVTGLNQISTMPSVTAIAQKIKDNDNDTLGIDEQVEQYLLDNYGGNEASVIMNLAGVSNLPIKMTALQYPIFRTIVSKIAAQVRTSMYNDQSIYGDSDDSTNSVDNGIDTSDTSSSSGIANI